MQPELIYFRWSHYNEKARWALEYKGIGYKRRTLLPGKHVKIARQLTGQTALPILIQNGRATHDSTQIIRTLEVSHPERPLYPHDADQRKRALELEEYFDEELGLHTRRLVVAACLPHTVYMSHLFDAEAGLVERWIYRGMLSVLKKKLGRRIGVDTAALEQSRTKVANALDLIKAEIQPDGFLVGNAFSVADMTAAAMLSVLILPPEFPCLPSRALPRSVKELQDAYCNHPAARWAYDMYRDYRGLPSKLRVMAGPDMRRLVSN